MFTTLHKRKAHYSRVRSTIVPSVACQTTEVTYRSPTLFFLQAKPCADHHLFIGYEPWLTSQKEKEKEKWNPLEKQVKKVEFPNLQRTDETGKFTVQNFSKSQPPNTYLVS